MFKYHFNTTELRYLFWKLNWILFNFRVHIDFDPNWSVFRVMSLNSKIGIKHGFVLSVIETHHVLVNLEVRI